MSFLKNNEDPRSDAKIAFRVCGFSFIYWLGFHITLAAHSKFIPLITTFITSLPWHFLLFLSVIVATFHVLFEKEINSFYNTRFTANALSLKLSYAQFKRATQKEQLILVFITLYVFIIGSTMSAIIAIFLASNSSIIAWILYFMMLGAILFVLKKIIGSWVYSYSFIPSNHKEK